MLEEIKAEIMNGHIIETGSIDNKTQNTRNREHRPQDTERTQSKPETQHRKLKCKR